MLESKILTLEDLIPAISWWLKLTTDDNFLVQLKDNPTSIETSLKAQSKLSEYLKPDIYDEADFEAAWTKSWQNHITECKKYQGFFGYKLEEHLVKPDGEKGQIIDIDISPECLNPIGVKWCSEETYYSVIELKTQKISELIFLQLENHVYYEKGKTNDYFRAFIGFKSKKLAQEWLRPIKKKIGELSHLKEFIEAEKPTDDKYHYQLEKAKHKRIERRIKNLEIVASWDLSQSPNF